jgi:uncharacterized protein (DUF362 family)
MSSATVALTQCSDYEPDNVARGIRRQFELLGGIERFVKPGDSVLLKPNFITPRSHRRAPAQTHPTVILEAAKLLKDFGARPFVADSPAWANAATCARVLELTEPLERLGVPLKELDASERRRLGPGLPSVRISRVALDADVIVNLAKLKTHQQLFATFAVKNMFGCVSGKRKALWHFKRGADTGAFCELLIGIYRHLHPAVTIIDGIVAMEGQGPIHGASRPLGWLIGGTEPIACERICCHLAGIRPEQVPIMRTAKEIGFGCANLDEIDVLGDALPPPCTDFELPRMAPIEFTFSHVCRSVARQIRLMARGFRAGQDPPMEY